jgi:hypothetical protein
MIEAVPWHIDAASGSLMALLAQAASSKVPSAGRSISRDCCWSTGDDSPTDFHHTDESLIPARADDQPSELNLTHPGSDGDSGYWFPNPAGVVCRAS